MPVGPSGQAPCFGIHSDRLNPILESHLINPHQNVVIVALANKRIPIFSRPCG